MLLTLAAHQVDYVLIGGQAARLYGSSMTTNDIDIVARDMPDNMARLADALNQLGAHSELADSASVDELWGMNTRWETSAGPIDVLVTAKGLGGSTHNWRSLSPRIETLKSDGVLVYVTALDDLIAMKLGAQRPRDLQVAEELVPGSTQSVTADSTDATQPPAADDELSPRRNDD